MPNTKLNVTSILKSANPSMLVTTVLLATWACGHKSSSAPAADSTPSDLSLTTDPGSLSSRLELVNSSLNLVTVAATALPASVVAVASTPLPASAVAAASGTVTSLLHVGSLTAPVSASVTLQANSVLVNGTLAYVAYNVSGADIAGAVDVIDLSTVAAPKLLSEAIFATSKINALALSGSTLFAVGETSSGTTPAFVKALTLNGGKLTTTVTTEPLTGFAGTAAAIIDGALLVGSGDNGGVEVLDANSMTRIASAAISEVRAIAVDSNNQGYVLTGEPGAIHVYDKSVTQSRLDAIGGATVAQAKSTLETSSGLVLTATGDGGARIECATTGALIASEAAVVVSGLDAADTVTNAATMTATALYTANGGAGVYVYPITRGTGTDPCRSLTLGTPRSIAFASGFSANAVFSSGNYLFVADGSGGLQIVTTN